MPQGPSRSAKFAAALALAFVFAFTQVTPGSATIVQFVSVAFDPTPDDPNNNDSDSDFDRINDSEDPITRNIFATVTGSGYSASGSVGAFGNLGTEGTIGGPVTGELSSIVVIDNDEIINRSAIPQNATANFIIDGGFFDLSANLGSTLTYSISLQTGEGDPVFVFLSKGELVSTSAGGSAASFTPSGDDIGATMTSKTRVDLPVAFVSVPLGLIEPEESFSLLYELVIEATINGFSEGTSFAYSDPLNVSGFGDFPTVTFEDAPVAQIPEPATLPLLVSALGALALLGWWRRAR